MDSSPSSGTSDPTFATAKHHRRWAACGALAAALSMVLVIGGASVGYANGVPARQTLTSETASDAGIHQAPAGLGAVTTIAAGYSHSLALRSNGTVVAWGANYYGALGNGQATRSLTPVPVCAVGESAPCTRFLTGVIAIAGGVDHSLALLRDRTVVAWGGNYSGQLGDGTTVHRTTPVRVCAVGEVAPCDRFLGGVRSLAAGWQHSLAVVDNALAVTWGHNGFGQLGDGTTIGRTTPVRVCAVGQAAPCNQFLYAVRDAAGGGAHSMALLGNGSAVTWGDNDYGQLGDGTTLYRTTPVRVCAIEQTAPCNQFLYGIRHISVGGGSNGLAWLSSGGVLAWGINDYGQVGDGTTLDRTTPVRVCAVGQTAPCTRHLSLIRAISSGGAHTLALQVDYTVVAWGRNFDGELGDGTTVNRSVPVRVLAPQPAARR